jgi:hypothetical protein
MKTNTRIRCATCGHLEKVHVVLPGQSRCLVKHCKCTEFVPIEIESYKDRYERLRKSYIELKIKYDYQHKLLLKAGLMK